MALRTQEYAAICTKKKVDFWLHMVYHVVRPTLGMKVESAYCVEIRMVVVACRCVKAHWRNRVREARSSEQLGLKHSISGIVEQQNGGRNDHEEAAIVIGDYGGRAGFGIRHACACAA